MTNNQNYRMTMLARKFGTGIIDEEFKYFKEFCRRFDSNPPKKRYGILIWGKEPLEENMLYNSDIGELRVLHCEKVCNDRDTGHDGIKVRKLVDWLEKMEGKQ